MSDYISRQAAINAAYAALAYGNRVYDNLSNLPAADVRPVVRAEWILFDGGRGKCPVCGFVQEAIWDYDHTQRFCGMCGAEMREETQ